ncbi:MAG: YceI family protein [Pseudomonadota bacterium]
MNTLKIAAATGAVILIAACGQAANGQATNEQAETSDVREEKLQEFDAVSGTYVSEATHRYITFSYLHQGYSRPHVRFDDWTGTLDWNADDPAASSIAVTINAASISSGVPKFDDHLRSADFFDTDAHPEITFASTRVERTGDVTGKITGDLTIKGVTKPVTLDVTYNKSAYEQRGKSYKIGFSATAAVKRSDFGVDKYTPFVGDDVEIVIEAEFEKPAEG